MKYLVWEDQLSVEEETDKHHMERDRRIPRSLADEMFARGVSGMGGSDPAHMTASGVARIST